LTAGAPLLAGYAGGGAVHPPIVAHNGIGLMVELLSGIS
jgi:hypothetical protein